MAMAVSFAIKSWIEGGVVTGVIILNIVVGFFQEFNAEKTMDSLRSLSSPTANVVRSGEINNIPTAELVPGDLVELKLGDTVPADVRLLESLNLETDEALLTGESLPVAKDEDAIFDPETGPGDRLNVVYSSSTVTKGRGRGIIYATGMHTEIGSIAAALRSGNSKVRPVKRRLDGTAHPFRYAESWSLTFTDAVGRFLGVNVGTPLQRKLSRLAMLLFGIAVLCAIIVLAANHFSNDSSLIIYAVATGLSMIPASLIVVLTITMAVGTKRMVQRHVIVRKMDALEALGGVTDICTDKTGTLTQGKMVARKCWIPSRGIYSIGTSSEPFNPTMGDLAHIPEMSKSSGEKSDEGTPLAYDEAIQENADLAAFLWVASLANLAHVRKNKEGKWHARGDPTEIALQVFASRFDFNRSKFVEGLKPQCKQVSEYPFDSDVKKMSVIFEETSSGEQMVYTKGAVESVLDSCDRIRSSLDDDAEADLNDEKRSVVLSRMEDLTSGGFRVLALASRHYDPHSGRRASRDGPPPRDQVEKNLVFRGLIGIYDSPRPESADAVRRCHRAGIKVHMLTGDHPGTARAIAIQVGILPAPAKVSKPMAAAMMMTASDFDRHTNDELDKLSVLPLVIARCAPNTKVRMIEALRRREAFMAMTGDGVNDSPSLKKADVGIAMGMAGSDVAKDASDIVLTDDNFASILNAIEEGRRMFDNIQKFVLHLLAENIAQACTLLIGLAFKDSSGISVFPLAPVQILWIIMITSGMPDMGLGMEVASPDILERPPQDLKRGVFTLEIMLDMLVYGLWMSALCLSSFLLVVFGFGDGRLGEGCNDAYSTECDTVFRARATTFVSLTWFALFLAWEMVDLRRSFFRMQPGSKRYLTQWMFDVWRNKFLFWAVIAGFVTIFPTLYIPVINHDVFNHTGITWEWGIVFVEAVLFFLGAEAWKWAKRVFLRRRSRKMGYPADDLEKRAFGSFLTEVQGANGAPRELKKNC
ncbi:P-type ATPase [Cladophialophora chaetospira]|uniref:P-type Na(+) transporter n=1 Tax=Cladophialophora chaetospira TaxID=386627 RepID=A0AA38X151_9EURO|nr:P-type ATPase [Cladophialophora chaetospira]